MKTTKINNPFRRVIARWCTATAAGGVVLSFVGVVVAAPTVPQNAPAFSLQGRLTNTGGTPVSGSANVVVALYGAATGGSPLCSESFTGASVVNGFYTIAVGTGSATPGTEASVAAALRNNAAVWYTLNVNSDGEMSPRTKLFATAYAANAYSLQGSRYYKDSGSTAPANLTETAEAGDLWFNTGANNLRYYNGSSWATLGTGGGSGDMLAANNLSDVANVATARTNLGLGTAATANTGTAAGNVLALSAASQLPALDGSLLTGLNATNITTGALAIGRIDTAGAASNQVLTYNGSMLVWSTPAGTGDMLLNTPQTIPIGGAKTFGDGALRLDGGGILTTRLHAGTLSADRDITFPNMNGVVLVAALPNDGSGLTNLNAANLTGSLPAIDGSALTGIVATDTSKLPLAGGVMSGSITFAGAQTIPTTMLTGILPSLDGSLLMNLNASNVSAGSLPVAYLPTGGSWALSGNLDIDGNRLFIDRTNSRLGVGTAAPTKAMHVKSTTGNGMIVEGTTGEFPTFILHDGTTERGQIAVSSGNDFLSTTGTNALVLKAPTGGHVAIGTGSIASNAGTATAIFNANGLGFGTADPVTTIDAIGYGAPSTFTVRYANGTSGAPTAAMSANILGKLAFGAYDGSAFASTVFVHAEATQPHTGANKGTDMVLTATPFNSNLPTEVLRLRADGGVMVMQSPTAPPNPVNGAIYYDIGMAPSRFRVFQDGAWVDMTGGGGVSFPLQGPIGSAGNPTYSFGPEPNTGMYLTTPNQLNLSVAGIDTLRILNGSFNPQMLAMANGVAAAPAWSFNSALNSGVYYDSPSTSVRVSVASQDRLHIIGGANPAVLAPTGGGSSAPTWSFIGDTDTGMYSPGADNLAFAVGGNIGIAIDQTGMVDIFTDGAKLWLPRKAATGDPAGFNGMVYYNTADAKFRGFENGAWKSLIDSPWVISGPDISYSGGEVGIGTPTPASPLEVAVNWTGGTAMTFLNNTATAGAASALSALATGAGGTLHIGGTFKADGATSNFGVVGLTGASTPPATGVAAIYGETDNGTGFGGSFTNNSANPNTIALTAKVATGTQDGYAAYFNNPSTIQGATGVYASASGTGGTTHVAGEFFATGGGTVIGAKGVSTGTGSMSVGGQFSASAGANRYGVVGFGANTPISSPTVAGGDYIGVYGETNYGPGYAVYGLNTAGSGAGIVGRAADRGVMGFTFGVTAPSNGGVVTGLYGETNISTGYGLFAKNQAGSLAAGGAALWADIADTTANVKIARFSVGGADKMTIKGDGTLTYMGANIASYVAISLATFNATLPAARVVQITSGTGSLTPSPGTQGQLMTIINNAGGVLSLGGGVTSANGGLPTGDSMTLVYTGSTWQDVAR